MIEARQSAAAEAPAPVPDESYHSEISGLSLLGRALLNRIKGRS